jgi:hypothetical protein
VSALLVPLTCCVAGFLKPEHPYYDVEVQQATYNHQLIWLGVTGAAFSIASAVFFTFAIIAIAEPSQGEDR